MPRRRGHIGPEKVATCLAFAGLRYFCQRGLRTTRSSKNRFHEALGS